MSALQQDLSHVLVVVGPRVHTALHTINEARLHAPVVGVVPLTMLVPFAPSCAAEWSDEAAVQRAAMGMPLAAQLEALCDLVASAYQCSQTTQLMIGNVRINIVTLPEGASDIQAGQAQVTQLGLPQYTLVLSDMGLERMRLNWATFLATHASGAIAVMTHYAPALLMSKLLKLTRLMIENTYDRVLHRREFVEFRDGAAETVCSLAFCNDRLNADTNLLDKSCECAGLCGPEVDISGSVVSETHSLALMAYTECGPHASMRKLEQMFVGPLLGFLWPHTSGLSSIKITQRSGSPFLVQTLRIPDTLGEMSAIADSASVTVISGHFLQSARATMFPATLRTGVLPTDALISALTAARALVSGLSLNAFVLELALNKFTLGLQNVEGSRVAMMSRATGFHDGSVLPWFAEQIRKGLGIRVDSTLLDRRFALAKHETTSASSGPYQMAYDLRVMQSKFGRVLEFLQKAVAFAGGMATMSTVSLASQVLGSINHAKHEHTPAGAGVCGFLLQGMMGILSSAWTGKNQQLPAVGVKDKPPMNVTTDAAKTGDLLDGWAFHRDAAVKTLHLLIYDGAELDERC
eukprot:2095939-Amphidinium_carterae.1